MEQKPRGCKPEKRSSSPAGYLKSCLNNLPLNHADTMDKKMNDPGYNPKRNRFPALLAMLMVLPISAPAGAHEAHDQQAPFITIWKTDNWATWRDGHLSGDNQIRIPGVGDEYTIEWEKVERVNDSWQGTDDSLNGVEAGSDAFTVTFPEPGYYRVMISGDFREIRFKGERHDIMPEYIYEYGDAEKLIEIEQWGDISWASMESAFYMALNLRVTAVDAPDLSQVSNMSEMFYHARSVNADFSHWDVSNVTRMKKIFSSAFLFNGDLSGWDVSSVTNMEMMFFGATSFNGDVSKWNVGNVTNMAGMFSHAFLFNSDVSGWDVSRVINMSFMFDNAFAFSGDISSWDVGNVTNMNYMLGFASSFNGDVSNWDVSNVTQMRGMFQRASSFDSDLSSWDVSNVTRMDGMLSRSALSVEHYDMLLTGWSNLSLQPGVALGANELKYCHAGEQRSRIIQEFDWTISDSGLAEGCDPVSVDYPEALPFENSLYQNYPNPFNPSTRIRYTLTEPSHVRLEIFDITGRRVAFPVDGFQTAGRYDIMFDASELAGGAYLYRLSAGSTSASKIMMLIK
jgi:surface protein